MAKTPKQTVTATHGSRADLVSAIARLIDADQATTSRLMGVTNKKLLRIHAVAQIVKERFGGKSGLIDAMAKLQFKNGKPNDGWREKMEGYTVKRLLDLHRQLKTTGLGAQKD